MRSVLAAAVTAVALAGCAGSGGGSSAPSRPSSPGPAATSTSSSAVDRAACRDQLRQGGAIADRSRLARLSLPQFQLHTNDLQEVLEEATHVCPRPVVALLKAASLRLLATDEYLLRCAPADGCDAARLSRALAAVEDLEHRARTAFDQ